MPDPVPDDMDSMVGRVISKGLEGWWIQAELVTETERAFAVREGGEDSRKKWLVTIKRYPYDR